MPVRNLYLAAALTLALSSAAHAGPPWISIELPANPHHASTRHASLLVRAYHHSTAVNAPVTGTAEGIVDGRRVSLPLELRATNQPGVFAVTTPVPKGGTWIMAITVNESGTSTATALVTIDPRGRIVAVDVPSTRTGDGWMVPRRVDGRDVEAALRAAHIAHSGGPGASTGVAFALPLLLVGGAVVVGALKQRTPGVR
ncbi:MAG: hypothetical protein ACREK1_13025 [Longimicrobiales bacterium]